MNRSLRDRMITVHHILLKGFTNLNRGTDGQLEDNQCLSFW